MTIPIYLESNKTVVVSWRHRGSQKKAGLTTCRLRIIEPDDMALNFTGVYGFRHVHLAVNQRQRGTVFSGDTPYAPGTRQFSRPVLRRESLTKALDTAGAAGALTRRDRADVWGTIRMETRGPWGRPGFPPNDWRIKSRALIACDGGGHGVVLLHRGPAIDEQITNVGNRLDDLCLDDAPEGLSVWEGNFSVSRCETDYGTDYDLDTTGRFRPLSLQELTALVRGEDPWPKNPPSPTTKKRHPLFGWPPAHESPENPIEEKGTTPKGEPNQ